MRTSSIFAVLAAGSAVFAAPAAPVADKREMNFGGVAGPLGSLLGGSAAAPLGASGQNALAAFFKAADTVLNIPTDTLRKAIQGDPTGAASGLLQSIIKAVSDLPKDAAGLVTPLAPKSS